MASLAGFCPPVSTAMAASIGEDAAAMAAKCGMRSSQSARNPTGLYTDHDAAEGRKLVERLDLDAEAARAWRHVPCEAIYCHPTTRARVFVGGLGAGAGRSRQLLSELEITRVVNGQGLSSDGYCEGDGGMRCFRFPV